MSVTREQELWAMALWVEREYGEDGERFIAERVLTFEAENNDGAVQLWSEVAQRYAALHSAEGDKAN